MAIDKQLEENAEVQLILKVHNLYKAETDKRIEDLLKEIGDLHETVKEKDERIAELTDVILNKDRAKCKVVTLRPAYAQ